MLSRFAPAKVNLALHVTGRREDGYHLLDTLVGFAAIGDELVVAPPPVAPSSVPPVLTLALAGRFGADLAADPDNLVLRAARLLRTEAGLDDAGAGAALTLVKDLPVASGIGGGSADAAAALLALRDHWRLATSPDRLAALALGLGADVPMCLAGASGGGRGLRAAGIGETLADAPAWPDGMGLVLANPGVAVATPAVFRALARRDSPPLPPLPAAWEDVRHLADWLGETRNDLSAPAIALAPVIAETLEALRRTPGCRIARMSGSGATCFALYDDEDAAARAARMLAAIPWVAAGGMW